MAKAKFTRSRVDDAPVSQLVAVYKAAVKSLLDDFDQSSDFSRARRLAILANVRAEMAKLGDKTQKWLDDNIPAAYKEGMNEAVAGLNSLAKKELLPDDAIKVKASFTLPNKQAVAAMVDDGLKSFGDSMTLVGRNVKSITTQSFQKEVRAKLAEGTITGETRKDIVAATKQQLKDRGLTALTDKGGKNWTLDRYADMLARTKLTEARNAGVANKMLENDQDLVQVSINGSDHQACADWEGKVVSVTGKNNDYPSLDEAEADGLFHPNCRHTINAVEPSLARETYGWNKETQSYEQGIIED